MEPPAGLPAILRPIDALDTTTFTSRALQLTQDTSEGKLVLGIDNIPSWEAEPLHAHVGDTEIWTVTNAMAWDHPFHLHGFFSRRSIP